MRCCGPNQGKKPFLGSSTFLQQSGRDLHTNSKQACNEVFTRFRKQGTPGAKVQAVWGVHMLKIFSELSFKLDAPDLDFKA